MLLWMLLTEIAMGAEEIDFSPRAVWEGAGATKRTVLVILAIMGVGTMIIQVERLIAYGRSKAQSVRLAQVVAKPMQAMDVAAALKLTEEKSYKAAYLGALLRAGLAELNQRFDRFGLENARRSMDKAIILEVGKLRRGTPLLASVGATAPFVGLFGTTIGIIYAFQAMAAAGTGLGAISQAIAEALWATAIGIGVAIIGVWCFNYSNTRVERITDELSASQADFLDWAEKELKRNAEGEREASK